MQAGERNTTGSCLSWVLDGEMAPEAVAKDVRHPSFLPPYPYPSVCSGEALPGRGNGQSKPPVHRVGEDPHCSS